MVLPRVTLGEQTHDLTLSRVHSLCGSCMDRACESGLQDGKGSDGVDQRAAVLLDIGIAEQHLVSLLAHLGIDRHPAASSGAQERERELRGGGHLSVLGVAARRSPHGGVHERGEHPAVQGATLVQVSLLRVEDQASVPVLGSFLTGSELTGKTVHHRLVPADLTPNTTFSAPA